MSSSFKRLPKDPDQPKQTTYSNGALRVYFSWKYAHIVHEKSNLGLHTSFSRTDDLGRIVHTVRDVLAIAEKINAMQDWTKSQKTVLAVCLKDNAKIAEQIRQLLPCKSDK